MVMNEEEWSGGLIYCPKRLCQNPKAGWSVVRGGDGTMLLAVYALAKYRKPFCGVNLGHLGFLLNSPSEFSLEKLRGEDYELFSVPFLDYQHTFGFNRLCYQCRGSASDSNTACL